MQVAFEAGNAALIVTPDPTLQYGHCKKAVGDAVGRFNRGERLAGLRDMCEDPLGFREAKARLHSFRGARNLVDHPVASKREEIKREKQFPERMMMGPRLIPNLCRWSGSSAGSASVGFIGRTRRVPDQLIV